MSSLSDFVPSAALEAKLDSLALSSESMMPASFQGKDGPSMVQHSSQEDQERSNEQELTKESSNTSSDEEASKKATEAASADSQDGSEEPGSALASKGHEEQQPLNPPAKMVIKLPPRLTVNEIREMAFTVKAQQDEDSKKKPGNAFGSIFSTMFGAQKIPKVEFKGTQPLLVEPINLSLKSSNQFSLDQDSEKPKSLFSYFGGSDSKAEKAKQSFLDSVASSKPVLPFGNKSGFKPVAFSTIVKQASWAMEKFPSMDDDNLSEDSSSQANDKELRKRVNSIEVTSKDGVVAEREAGFLSIEKSGGKSFNVVWRTLTGQNPLSVEISSQVAKPQEIESTKADESRILVQGSEDDKFSEIKILFFDQISNGDFIKIFDEYLYKINQ